MKILYLLPPSEGKNTGGTSLMESITYMFEKPHSIAECATEKDLKCTGTRYQEGIELNKNIYQKDASNPCSIFISAIERYSGVMYNAIDYVGMTPDAQKYFTENFIILSGMYGMVSPLDMIGNYKLPIETKGLRQFWDTKITKALNQVNPDVIVDLLPGSYAKMIQWKNIDAKIVRVNFLHIQDGVTKKMTHGVKKVKGEYIKQLCENGGIDIGDLGKEQGSIDIRR